jgi:hypothetical protein
MKARSNARPATAKSVAPHLSHVKATPLIVRNEPIDLPDHLWVTLNSQFQRTTSCPSASFPHGQ